MTFILTSCGFHLVFLLFNPMHQQITLNITFIPTNLCKNKILRIKSANLPINVKLFFFFVFLQILNEIAQHKIKIYEFPDCDDEDENKHQKKLKVCVVSTYVLSRH